MMECGSATNGKGGNPPTTLNFFAEFLVMWGFCVTKLALRP